ncbi:MAG: nucleoside 2-deoxyribosyltransferase [Candidatus Gottesmanbacteria bacterium GW2011_GWA2_43_14]|uniref:Nucleoside 2-deoxyribosyltransferase n=1 Tax=Candidatus Gottesmanbacteria bacterium GW2011_GWA2_43_14 TaxID=1618443 RepID=A0A0G1DI34_9BACT|nr:MAG: nucleoside 2-deoxyribosyltransferase [Candidatus Gottesmanbacteria bacterium GW2011_GWA2_43_14]
MKAYFTASIAGKNQYLQKYLGIIGEIKQRGFEVIADHIIKTEESEVNLSKREDRLFFHKKLEKWISQSSFMIAEVSFPSISVGYEISLALHLGKPVLVLYSEGHPPSLLAYHKDEKLMTERYNSDNLPGIIEDFVNFVKGPADMRFTFYITREIAAYLDKITRNKKLPKAVYLRKLVEEDMKKNKS